MDFSILITIVMWIFALFFLFLALIVISSQNILSEKSRLVSSLILVVMGIGILWLTI